MIQVYATDADGSGPSGQVKYSIVSKHNKFTIDPHTGWLTTNAVRTLSVNYYNAVIQILCMVVEHLMLAHHPLFSTLQWNAEIRTSSDFG